MKRHIAIFDLQKPTYKVSSGSVFAKYAKKNFGLIAREFNDKDTAIEYIKHFMAAKGSYVTTAEDVRSNWSNKSTRNQDNFSISLRECEAEDIKYLLFVSEDQEQTHAYECLSRDAALRQAKKVLDENDLVPIEEENENGYWFGVLDTGAEIIIELRLVVDDGQYLNINPRELLTAKEQDLFVNAPIETINKQQVKALLVVYSIILILSVIFFIITRIMDDYILGYLPGISIVVAIVLIINTLKKA